MLAAPVPTGAAPKDGLFGIALLVLAAFALPHGAAIEVSGGISRNEAIGPGFFPIIYLVGLALAGALLVVTERNWRSGWMAALGQAADWRTLGILIGLGGGYGVALERFGYLLPTLLFQAAALALVFRMRGLVRPAIAALFLTGGAFGLLHYLLEVPLPRGTGSAYDLNRLLY